MENAPPPSTHVSCQANIQMRGGRRGSAPQYPPLLLRHCFACVPQQKQRLDCTKFDKTGPWKKRRHPQLTLVVKLTFNAGWTAWIRSSLPPPLCCRAADPVKSRSSKAGLRFRCRSPCEDDEWCQNRCSLRDLGRGFLFVSATSWGSHAHVSPPPPPTPPRLASRPQILYRAGLGPPPPG